MRRVMEPEVRGGPVDVEVESLVVEVSGPGQADLLARAIEAELGRLLAEHGLPASALHDREVGAVIARAVHAELARERMDAA